MGILPSLDLPAHPDVDTEEVAACLQPRSGFEGRRNILVNCRIQLWPVPAPISCPGGGPEGVGNGQGCKVSFYFTQEEAKAQRDQTIKGKNHTVTSYRAGLESRSLMPPVYNTSVWGLHNLHMVI